jgi:transposase-like protein
VELKGEFTVLEPQTLSEAVRYYSNEQTCIDLLACIRWPDGQVICTNCGEIGNTIWLANQKRWKCRGCKKQFSIKVGTIMEDSPIGLDKWMVTFWMLANCRNGVSSYDLGDHPKAAIDDQVKSGHREKA